ncbi:unnamed protein product [Pleuronectes platessa]|uniref:Uncharacterized protein n=1 Tax=Pleuronectes platessa TaxID=8262 RepID=A0A9N7YF25_PLEPL|nr:unnamed protein product [Pleuronectes platessa]
MKKMMERSSPPVHTSSFILLDHDAYRKRVLRRCAFRMGDRRRQPRNNDPTYPYYQQLRRSPAEKPRDGAGIKRASSLSTPQMSKPGAVVGLNPVTQERTGSSGSPGGCGRNVGSAVRFAASPLRTEHSHTAPWIDPGLIQFAGESVSPALGWRREGKPVEISDQSVRTQGGAASPVESLASPLSVTIAEVAAGIESGPECNTAAKPRLLRLSEAATMKTRPGPDFTVTADRQWKHSQRQPGLQQSSSRGKVNKLCEGSSTEHAQQISVWLSISAFTIVDGHTVSGEDVGNK